MVGKKSGFLTDPRRDYLRVSASERDEKYSASQKSQFEEAIAEQANLAVGDLILAVRGCSDESLKVAFPPREIAELIDALLDRIGMDEVAEREHYYEVILKAIEHRIHEKYREQGRFFKLESSDYPVMPSKPAYRDLRAYTRK